MMKKGFTIIELLTVVAIMSILGVAAAGSYNALVRGMKERGAVAAASALLRSAKERAMIDRVPTAVFCYNRLLRGVGDGDSDENATVVGVMTAVRRSGRISYSRGNFLYDEFGDLLGTYECLSDMAGYSTDGEAHSASELERHRGMKLYRFPAKNGDMRYSIVADAVWLGRNDMREYVPSLQDETNVCACAFYLLGSQGKRKVSSWSAGDAYAFEIAEIQLPDGIIFGSDIPSDVTDISNPVTLYFDPDEDTNPAIEVNTTKTDGSGRPTKWKSAGTASAQEGSTT